MNKVFIWLMIGVAVLGLIAAGVLAASWFWTGQAVPRLGSNFSGMPMMSGLRLPGFMANLLMVRIVRLQVAVRPADPIRSSGG